MSTPMKHALVDHPEPAWKVAKLMDKTDAWLSRVVCGIITPKETDKEKLSEILNKPVDELFPPEPIEAA